LDDFSNGSLKKPKAASSTSKGSKAAGGPSDGSGDPDAGKGSGSGGTGGGGKIPQADKPRVPGGKKEPPKKKVEPVSKPQPPPPPPAPPAPTLFKETKDKAARLVQLVWARNVPSSIFFPARIVGGSSASASRERVVEFLCLPDDESFGSLQQTVLAAEIVNYDNHSPSTFAREWDGTMFSGAARELLVKYPSNAKAVNEIRSRINSVADRFLAAALETALSAKSKINTSFYLHRRKVAVKRQYVPGWMDLVYDTYWHQYLVKTNKLSMRVSWTQIRLGNDSKYVRQVDYLEEDVMDSFEDNDEVTSSTSLNQ